jgi:serine palmitoyltransferase
VQQHNNNQTAGTKLCTHTHVLQPNCHTSLLVIHIHRRAMGHRKDPEISFFTAFLTYLSYVILICIGHLRDFFANVTGITRYEGVRTKKGYSQLLKSWESFFTRRLYHRIQDCWNRPISSNPGSYFDVMERKSDDENCTLHTTGKTLRCLNLGSYNYLGFGDNWVDSCSEDVMDTLSKEPVAATSSRMDFGTNSSIVELETAVADFLGKEDAIVLTMGYGTNFTTIPALLGKNSLIISDSLNHTSLVNGSRSSSAQIRVFTHNDPAHLEQVLRESIIQGQPRHHRPWAKIVVMVEGIYSMEGAICNLPEIIKICKKYKAYVYVDEAHSVGALGKTGRGICEYHGVDTNDVDVLMVCDDAPSS